MEMNVSDAACPVLALGVTGFAALLLVVSSDLKLGLIAVAGFAGAVLLFALLSWLAIKLLRASVNESSAPRALVLAVGYEDGWILMIRLDDGAELLVRKGLDEGETPPRDKPVVSALAWDKDGQRLLFGLETGEAGLLTLP